MRGIRTLGHRAYARILQALPPSGWTEEIRASRGRGGLARELLLSLAAVIVCLLLEGLLVFPYFTILFSARIAPLSEALAAGEISEAAFRTLAKTELGAALASNGFALFSLFSTSLAAVGAIFYWRVLRRRSYASLGLSSESVAIEYPLGLLFGALMLGSVLLIGLATRAVAFDPAPAASVAPTLLVSFFIGHAIRGFSEELLCRGVVMSSLSRYRSLPVSVAASALVYALLHVAQPGMCPIAFLNLFLFGVFSAVYALRRGSLWGSAALHTAWNLMQTNIFGISTGAAPRASSIFHLLPSSVRPLLSGGAHGLEGGLLVSAVLVLFTVLICVIPTTRKPLQASGD